MLNRFGEDALAPGVRQRMSHPHAWLTGVVLLLLLSGCTVQLVEAPPEASPAAVTATPLPEEEEEPVAAADDGAESAAPEDGSAQAASVVPTVLELPDGAACSFAGEGATLAFDGKRLNYNCDPLVTSVSGLLGDLVVSSMGDVVAEQATIEHGADGFVLDDVNQVDGLASVIDLDEGIQCFHAGEGATLAFDGKRLNYTCYTPGPDEVGLIGDLQVDASGRVTAERAEIGRDESGFVLDSSTTTEGQISEIILDDGTRCLFAGEGATLAFDGKRLNYTCQTAPETSLGIIGEINQPVDGELEMELARIGRGDNGFILEESSLLRFTVQQVVLVDGSICLFAGEGATLAFDGQRLNYTCPAGDDGEVGLIGPLLLEESGVWAANRGLIVRGDDGFELASLEIVDAALLSGRAPSGAQATSPFTGRYAAQLPAASSPGRMLTLWLEPDGSVELATDSMNDEEPVVEIGSWMDNGDGTATVLLTGRKDGAVYDAPILLVFILDGDMLTAVEWDAALYGAEGLTLEREP